ncbi:hypothetical protein H0H92_013687 [Tricholoma furcatifolium]|nr:hypothetical protein H0H92_013687 [Tricholoma furcatifolium]
MCEIHGLHIPDSRTTTHYVPLHCANYPDVIANRTQPLHYNPANLPLCSHESFLQQAREVQSAVSNVEAEHLSKLYEIKAVPILSHISSLYFPESFPHDFMHLIDENNLKNLTLHWTGAFKGLDDGIEDYELPKAIWDAVGAATAASGATIPSAYGSRVPNIATDRSNCSAEMWSFWALYIAPVVLQHRFTKPKYFKHYILLKCLQFEITDEEITEVHHGFIQIYYQHNPERISTCPVTVHVLLHIADRIKAAGPYEMFVDKNAAYRQRQAKFELKTFYGQPQHIFVLKFNDLNACNMLQLSSGQNTIILAAIRTCQVDRERQLEELDMHFYLKMGRLDVVDITCIQALVGRVKDGERAWGIIDRSGSLARALELHEYDPAAADV